MKKIIRLSTVLVLVICMTCAFSVSYTAATVSRAYEPVSSISDKFSDDSDTYTSYEGMAVGDRYCYSVKIKKDSSKEYGQYAKLLRTDLKTNKTVTLKVSGSSEYVDDDKNRFKNYFLGHANDVVSTTLDDKYTTLFVACGKDAKVKSPYDIVQLRVNNSGNDPTVEFVKGYKVTDKSFNVYGIGISKKDLKNNKLEFILKNGSKTRYKVYKVSTSLSNYDGTKVINSSNVTTKNSCYLNLESYSDYNIQGIGVNSGVLYVPMTKKNHSVIIKYNLNNFSFNSSSPKTYSSSDVISIRSKTYSTFEIESCGISNSTGRLYFNANRNNSHDMIGYVTNGSGQAVK